MKTYLVSWTGASYVEAENKEDAKKICHDRILANYKVNNFDFVVKEIKDGE